METGGGFYPAAPPGVDGPGDRGRQQMMAALRAMQAGEAQARRN
jgi:hypothetical protein